MGMLNLAILLALRMVLIVIVAVLLLVVEAQTMILKEHVITVVMVIDVLGYTSAIMLAARIMKFNV
jgi:hypothetical protein